MVLQKIVKVVRTLVVIFIALIMVIIGAGYFFEDEIKTLTVKAINNNLKTEIKVSDINFSLIKNFPYASVEFQGVFAAGSNKNIFGNKSLLQAKSLSMLFNVISLLKKDYIIKKIVLADASVNILVNKNGFTNYDIFKNDSSSNNDMHFEVEKFETENVSVYQRNSLNGFEQEFLIHHGDASGNFSAKQYAMKINANIFFKKLIENKVAYISQKETQIELAIEINSTTRVYKIAESKFKVADFSFSGSGTINNSADETHLDIAIKSAGAKANEVLSLLPKGILPEQFFNYQFKGNVIFTTAIKGYSSKTSTPAVTVQFSTKNTDIIPGNETYSLRKVSLDGIYTNRKSESNPVSYLQLKNFSALLEDKPIKANIEIENFSKPLVNIQFDGDISLASLQRYIKSETIQSVEGMLNVHGFFRGQTGNTSTFTSGGNIRFSDIDFKIKHKPLQFENLSGYLLFNGNDVMINNFSGQAGKSDWVCTGKITNLFAFLLQKNQTLHTDVILASNTIDVNELMASDQNIKEDTLYRIDFPPNISSTIKANVDTVFIRKFVAYGAKGNLSLQNKELSTHSLVFRAVDGNVSLQGAIDASQPDSLLITYMASVSKLNIQKLFAQMGNFNQNVLLDKNINGTVSADIQFASLWSKTLHINSNSIYAKCNIAIDNGELINFEPMLKLSKYVKGADLKDIKFNTLKNQIEIKNRKIYFPKMEINSTALNMTASGWHDFDNMVNYSIQLRLSQLLGKRVKEQNTEFGTIEDDGLGGLKLYLTMKGPLSNPKFAYDRKSVEQNIVNTIKEEKKNFINIIKEEFKGNKTQQQDKKKKEELQIDNSDDSKEE